jgi:hypothetical protein
MSYKIHTTNLDFTNFEVQQSLIEISINLASTSNCIEKCKFCGVKYPTRYYSNEDAAKAVEHGRGCIWSVAMRLYGFETWQR